jgi:hypothetical protein
MSNIKEPEIRGGNYVGIRQRIRVTDSEAAVTLPTGISEVRKTCPPSAAYWKFCSESNQVPRDEIVTPRDRNRSIRSATDDTRSSSRVIFSAAFSGRRPGSECCEIELPPKLLALRCCGRPAALLANSFEIIPRIIVPSLPHGAVPWSAWHNRGTLIGGHAQNRTRSETCA